jgi:hypothetical protein
MKESIQNKINQIKKLAESQHLKGKISAPENLNSEDSLVKGIRNKEDAAFFLAELNSAIQVSQKK